MDIIRVEVDARVLLHEQKEEMFLQLQRAVDAIYGGRARLTVESNATQFRQRWSADGPAPARHIMQFGRKANRSLGG